MELKLELCYFFFKLKLITKNGFLLKLEQNERRKKGKYFWLPAQNMSRNENQWLALKKCNQGFVGENVKEGTIDIQEQHKNSQVPGRKVPFDPDEEWAEYLAMPPEMEEDVAQKMWTEKSEY